MSSVMGFWSKESRMLLSIRLFYCLFVVFTIYGSLDKALE